MPAHVAPPLPRLPDAASTRSAHLKSKLAAQQTHMLRLLQDLKNNLQDSKLQLPADLLPRIVSAYEEVSRDLEAIDPDNPPDVRELRCVGLRLRLLQAGIAKLLSTVVLLPSKPADHQRTYGE